MCSFKTVARETESVTVIERSKFICTLKGIEDEDDAREFIERIRKKYSLANHNCYAYIADERGTVQKFSDAGEPQGTAGLPMLNALKNRGLKKVCAVVTRYFGGIKLGTGGLARAYGGAVLSTLDAAEIRELFGAEFITAELTYSQYQKLSAIRDERFSVVSTEYGETVNVKLALRSDKTGSDAFERELKDLFGGDVKIERVGSGYFTFN